MILLNNPIKIEFDYKLKRMPLAQKVTELIDRTFGSNY